MTTFDMTLAGRLDALALDADRTPGGIAEVMITAASRLRQLAGLPDHLLPPPPIAPTRLEPMPAGAFEDVLELRDGLGDGMHDAGAMPTRNARLKRPTDSLAATAPLQIYEDPRLKPGYKPSKR